MRKIHLNFSIDFRPLGTSFLDHKEIGSSYHVRKTSSFYSNVGVEQNFFIADFYVWFIYWTLQRRAIDRIQFYVFCMKTAESSTFWQLSQIISRKFSPFLLSLNLTFGILQ